MQTPKKFCSFSDQVFWISDEKGIKIKDREYAEEMLRQIGYFPLRGGYKHLFRISNTKKFTEMYGAEQKQYLDANNYNNTKRNHATIVFLMCICQNRNNE